MSHKNCCRVVLTGGPGGGKTTAADLFRREIGSDVVIVPEAATILYSGGFPRPRNTEDSKATQRAIYHVQKNLEEVQFAHYQNRILLCDRGTLDGTAYWPLDSETYFEHMQTTLEEELSRYDAVVFFETAAVGGISIEGGNPIRNESLEQAILLDKKLRSIWEKHKNFHLIKHETSFMKKINYGLKIINQIVIDHRNIKKH